VTVGVRLPCFRLGAALRHTLSPDAAAFLIERDRRHVVEASDAAARAGVGPGMALAPRAAVVLEDRARAALAWRRVLDVLARLPAPVVDDRPGTAFMLIPHGDRPERWFGRVRSRLESLGLAVRCGAGTNRFIALVATHRVTDTVCPPGREAAFVADAPLELLSLGDDVALRLRLLGIRTVGDLAALPPAYFHRFGGDALRLHELAYGGGEAASVPHR
jgi:protein ImuB